MVASKHHTQHIQWLALHFPHLALDRHFASGDKPDRDKPHAISDKRKSQQLIIDLNPAAEQAGVQTGMPVGAALGLLDSLQVLPREQSSEANTLKRLANWCYQYSSQLVLIGQQNSLLLEVGRSQRLFGPTRTLAQRVCADIRGLGYRALAGIAPTPEAALLASRHQLFIHSPDDIRQMIGQLGIETLNLQTSQLRALQKMGFRTAGEIFRLPRKALARRLGLSVSDYLDRLLGNRPDPRQAFRPAECFSAGMEVAETGQTEGLVFPLNRLVQELCGVLRAQDRGIQALHIRLQHDRGSQKMSLNMYQSTRSEEHLMRLTRERLERLQLSRPVRHIQVHAEQFLPCAASQAGLLRDAGSPDAARDTARDTHVIERLQARLGAGAVMGIRGLEDHRPEHSWCLRELDAPTGYAAKPGRPGWLLAEPKPCDISEYRILTGPERIETGWWDGRDCRRDYFIVRDTAGGTLWAFHEYKPRPGWYLHGLFA
jgi:protein ImuB